MALTAAGESLISFARSILETTERAERHFAGTKLRGRVRFGASEDLVASWLPSVLASFTHDHPEMDLEFTIALSSTLTARYDAGDLDVVLCKRWPGEERGDLVWRDRIVWVGSASVATPSSQPVPLVFFPPPSITRSITLAALGQTSLPWRVACVSASLRGIVAACAAGRGITTLARPRVPPQLRELRPDELGAPLPPLGSLDFILLRSARAAQAPAAELSAAILAKARKA